MIINTTRPKKKSYETDFTVNTNKSVYDWDEIITAYGIITSPNKVTQIRMNYYSIWYTLNLISDFNSTTGEYSYNNMYAREDNNQVQVEVTWENGTVLSLYSDWFAVSLPG